MIDLVRYAVGDTREFSAPYSAAPLQTPHLAIWKVSGGSAFLVHSATMLAETAIAFSTFYTFPGSVGFYSYVITAQFSAGPVLEPSGGGMLEVVDRLGRL